MERGSVLLNGVHATKTAPDIAETAESWEGALILGYPNHYGAMQQNDALSRRIASGADPACSRLTQGIPLQISMIAAS